MKKLESSDKAKELYDKASSFGDKFDKVVFPHEFFNSSKKYDLVLLINVCNIMPVPAERLLVLQYVRQKLADKGLVLWYNQHKDPQYVESCKPEVAIGDGFYMKEEFRFQTFYRDFETCEINEMFYANGFKLEEKIPAGHNHALLYKKWGKTNPLDYAINAELIRKYVEGDIEIDYPDKTGIQIVETFDEIQTNVPNPDELRPEQLYLDTLSQIPAGKPNATVYHSLITALLIRLFVPPLENPQIEKNLHEGLERIDIIMTNNAKEGFFNFLYNSHNIPCHYIPIECKNYNLELKNSELQQLAGRLNDKRGKFGILTFRKTSDKNKLLKQCKGYLEDGKYIICLNDEDIIQLLNFKIAEDSESINEFLDNKIQELDF